MSDKTVSEQSSETNRCAEAVLEYLVANSELARELESPTLEELLAHQEDKEHCVRLLATLPQLEKDRFKMSNCLIYKTLPYDSLEGLSNADLETLAELCKYFMLPRILRKKLNKVIDNGSDIKNYDFNIKRTSEWAEIGDLRGLQWAYEMSYWTLKGVCASAAHGGYLDCLQYAHKHDCELDENTCLWAACNGHLDCLKYACEHGCYWAEETCSYAAENGHLDCLKYARENGCGWGDYMYENTAEVGQLECLKYIHKSGCPKPKNNLESLCRHAAMSGNVECLRYLHEAGFPWDEQTCAYAADYGHIECLRYAHE